MTTYFVSSGGSNTSPYDTWAKAATDLQTVLDLATSAGDVVVIQYNGVPSGIAEVGATTTFTISAAISVVSASNDGGSSYTPTAMGTANWIGNSTTNRSIAITGAFSAYFYGITIRCAGSTAANLMPTLNSGTGCDFTFEDCYFWQGNTATTAYISIGASTATIEQATSFINCTFRFGNASQGFRVQGGSHLFSGCDIAAAAGTTPTNIILDQGTFGSVVFEGCDVSNVGTSLIANQSNGHKRVTLRQCKIPSTLMSAQTTYANRSQAEVTAYDCDTADNHYQFIYNNGIGELVVDAGVYITADGAAYNTTPSRCSWKITTTSAASFRSPFITPWISLYNESTSLTPYVEALRKGSTTKYKESELWADWMYKDTANTTRGRMDRADRNGIVASTTDQAASSLSASDWTGEDVTNNAFMKLSPGAITPTEAGDISVRICVGKASVTDIYIDPKIRT